MVGFYVAKIAFTQFSSLAIHFPQINYVCVMKTLRCALNKNEQTTTEIHIEKYENEQCAKQINESAYSRIRIAFPSFHSRCFLIVISVTLDSVSLMVRFFFHFTTES